MNYGNYEKETISKLDIIGSYIIDLYYNKLYNKAISVKESTESSITESYKYVINTYIKHVGTIDFYKALFQGVYFYTTISTKYNSMSHKQCLDFFVEEFIPKHYVPSMTEVQKNNIMFMILKNTLTKFTNSVLEKYLSMIIDEHLETENIIVLQDEFLKLILKERDSSYTSFVSIEYISQDSLQTKHKKNKELLIESLNKEKRLIISIERKNRQIEILKATYKNCFQNYKNAINEINRKARVDMELRKIIEQQIKSHKLLDAKIRDANRKIEELSKSPISRSKSPLSKTSFPVSVLSNSDELSLNFNAINDTILPETNYASDEE